MKRDVKKYELSTATFTYYTVEYQGHIIGSLTEDYDRLEKYMLELVASNEETLDMAA